MIRRKFVIASIGAGTSILAGCLDGFSGNGNSSSGPADTQFAGLDCPEIRKDVQNTICYHIDDGTQSFYIKPSQETLGPGTANEVQQIEFELINDSENNISFDPTGWKLFQQKNQWDPYLTPEPELISTALEPGESYSWRLDTNGTPYQGTLEDPEKEFDPGISESGKYAFSMVVDDNKTGESIETVAIFEYNNK